MPNGVPRARVALLTISLALLTVLGASGVAEASGPARARGASAASADARRQRRIERVIKVATQQVGDPWVWGMRGPRAFDCIGLVWYAFHEARAMRMIGKSYHTIPTLRALFARRGLAGRHHGRRGDLVIWGRNKHIGIYLGHGRAVSALVRGVRIHRVHELYDPFTTFLHLRR